MGKVINGMKECTGCKVVKSADYEHFYKAVHGRFFPKCIECVSQERKEKRKNDDDTIKSYYRARYWQDIEKSREYSRTLTQKPEHKARIKIYGRKWREENKDRILENQRKNKEKVHIWNRRWSQKNPEKRRMHAQRRRAAYYKAEGSYTTEDIQAQYKRQKGKCYYCSVKLNKKFTIEHIIPLSRGGSNDPSNLVVACPFCNFSKNDRLPHEWVRGGRLL